MKRLIACMCILLLGANSLGYAEKVSFNSCKLADAKGKQADATLIFSDDAKNMQIRVSDRDLGMRTGSIRCCSRGNPEREPPVLSRFVHSVRGP